MSFVSNAFTVSNATELGNLTISEIQDNMNVLVLEPNAGHAPATYTFRSDLNLSSLPPLFVRPSDGSNGTWVSSNNTYVTSSNPAIAPPLIGLYWVVVNFPNKTIWLSVGTSAVSDWIPLETQAIQDSGSPSFSADYIGQIYVDDNSIVAWGATDTSGTWQQLSP